MPSFLTPVLQDYATAAAAAPPPLLTGQRASACEICDRDWIPLTYHHLIPKEVHAKAVKRGWHERWRLESVAWLCRACHSFGGLPCGCCFPLFDRIGLCSLWRWLRELLLGAVVTRILSHIMITIREEEEC